MRDIEYILDFAVHLGSEMLASGANLERANYAMEITLHSYGLHEVSVVSLSSNISVSAKDSDCKTFVRQASVPVGGIHLTRLRKLNELSREVSEKKPDPEDLEDKLYEALMVPSYGPWIELLGFMIAIVCLGRIFGGTITDLAVIVINTFVAYWVSRRLARESLNRIITNGVCLFITTSITFFFMRIGFAKNIMPILTATSMIFIPGVPLVNSVRNLLCGNEMNGILELLKAVLEVATIVAGVFVAYYLFGRWYTW